MVVVEVPEEEVDVLVPGPVVVEGEVDVLVPGPVVVVLVPLPLLMVMVFCMI